MKIQSSPLTFIDQTDSRKLEVYIKSNLPTVQIFNVNSGAYTPDWREGEKLILTTNVFLDSREMIDNEYSSTFIKWYKDEISEQTEIKSNRNQKVLTIETNELASNPIITYICEATYQGIVAASRLTFVRTDTGRNGEKGDDGTSIRILGTADSVALVDGTNYYTIVYSEGAVVAADIGDAYMYRGDLYVCSVLDSDGTNDYFVNVGQIQGQKGDDAKSIVLSGNSQVFKVGQTNTITPSTITVVAQTSNTSVNSWSYSINGGHTFLSTIPTGVAREGNIVTITGSKLSTDTLVIKASDGTIDDIFTVYKTYDGIDGAHGDNGEPASLAFLTNENISFAANANGQVSLTSLTTNVVAYRGTEKVMPTIGTPSGMPDGMTISVDSTTLKDSSKEVVLTISIANNKNLGSASSNHGTITIPITNPVSTNLILSWSKINAGPTGVGISSTTVTYGVSDSSSAQPTDWQSAIPTVAEGKYLWTRTIIDYTDTSKSDTVTYTDAKQGSTGEKGSPGTSVTVSSIQYQEGSYATTAPTGTWSNAVVAVADGKYLWTKTTFSDGKIAYGVAKQGSAGTAASLVNITPSALYFKSTTGANGTFTPQYIYLYPNFQNATYSSWQYSTDGTTWTSASGANGLTIGTYNSVANSLRVDRTSTLYTSSVTSISFRCNSTNTSVYDIVSIAKIYDVADLQIGGRNLITNTSSSYRNLSVTPHTGVIKDISYSALFENGLNVGDLVTFSVYVKTNSGKKLRARLEHYNNEDSRISKIGDSYIENGEGFLTITTPLVGGFDKLRVQVDANLTSSTLTSTTTEEYKFAKLEKGNKATDWSPAPEDLLNEAANVNVMLSNESHFFEATASGIPTATSVVLDVVGYKGSVQSSATVGTISGLPSAGMTATITSNSTTSTKITIAVTEALTSADYGVLTIPVTVNGYTINKKFSWVKAKAGDPGTSGVDAVTFQVYSTNGYALSINTPAILLQTFAYVGDTAIQTGATYQWYSYAASGWTAISGATNAYYTVSRDNVSFSNSYMCKMQFNGAEYVGVATIDDKSDDNKVFTTKPSNYTAGDLWIVGSDYKPSNVEIGTLLKAQYTNKTYADADWIKATRYDEQLKDLQDNLTQYNQYFSFDSAQGVKITAKDSNGVESKYSTTISNDEWAINYGSEAVTYVDETKMHIKEAEIESPLTITGKYSGSTMLQAPIINIGNFSFVIESNGSLSVVVKS